MCPIEWYHELVLYLSEAEIKVLTAIMSSGREECGEAGQPCITLRARQQALAEDARVSTKSAVLASQSLEAAGVLTVFLSSSPHGVNAYRLYVHLPRRLIERLQRARHVKTTRLEKQPSKNYMADQTSRVKIPDPLAPLNNPSYPRVVDVAINTRELDPATTTTTPPPGGSHVKITRLIQRLTELGVLEAERFVSGHPADRIEAAIDYVTDPLASHVRNPAAFLVYLLESASEIPTPQSVTNARLQRTRPEEDPERYIKGRYGHVVKR